jgi:exodeoxyribonuclease VII large subunit
MRVDDLVHHLILNIHQQMRKEREHMHWAIQKLGIFSPENRCSQLKEKLDINIYNLINNWKKNIDKKKSIVKETANTLELLNPIAILSRGYSITRTIPDKSVVRDAEAVSKGQQLEILLGKGSLNVTVGRKQ